MTNEVDDLVTKVQKQLYEHMDWLAAEISNISPDVMKINETLLLVMQARQIKLRVVKASRHVMTAVYDYPDELYAFLRSDRAPKALRDSLEGGHVVDPNQPASSAARVVDHVE